MIGYYRLRMEANSGTFVPQVVGVRVTDGVTPSYQRQ